ncbi:adenylyl-sulfate kinase [Caballeronia sp. AZ10_KS36]|uniref:adenylyl-sulfate kinase n=1 Tax=Caballeronia sp. AZ10_KS36 TaxID=2921757 RepID=UPI00202848A9
MAEKIQVGQHEVGDEITMFQAKDFPCVWLTGLSGAGKSTIANGLIAVLRESGQAALLLDGDVLRNGLSRDLSFSVQDRAENIRRAAEIARLAADAGIVPVVALISPLRSERARAKEIVGDSRFIEIFVDTPLTLCEARDPKGLYVQARKGAIKEFTGISSPYEAPESPDVHLSTEGSSPDQCVQAIMNHLARRTRKN